jgi:hypothetical protein
MNEERKRLRLQQIQASKLTLQQTTQQRKLQQQQQNQQKKQHKQQKQQQPQQVYQLNKHQQDLLTPPLPQRPRLLDTEDFDILRKFLLFQGTPRKYRKYLCNYYIKDFNSGLVDQLVTPPNSDDDSDSSDDDSEDDNNNTQLGADDDDNPIMLPN